MIWGFVVAVLLGAMPACEDSAPDGAGLTIEVTPDQPDSPALGILMEIHARGGSGVYVSVERGTFVAETMTGAVPMPSVTACLPSMASNVAPFTYSLSVRPAEREALLFAVLYAGADCSGVVVQSRLLAVRPPAVNPVQVDAGSPDGGAFQ